MGGRALPAASILAGMAPPDGRGRRLPALALVVVGLVVALQALPLIGPPGAGPGAPVLVTDAAPSAPPSLTAVPAPEPSPAATSTVTAVTPAVLSFSQDALLDPVVTGRVTGAGGVRVAAQVLTEDAWVEQGAVVAGADGAFALTLAHGHGEPRTDRWRLVADGVASAEVSVTRLAVARPEVRAVKAADIRYTWREGCPVHHTQLRVLDINHYGFDGRLHRGQLVVQAKVVDRFVALIQTTIDHRFPIRTMRSAEAFEGDDNASGDADNTSAFNCRLTTGGTRWSDHAFGVAIDINPVENPYSDGQILPAAGRPYLDRSNVRPGMLTADSPVVRYALANGWDWLSPHDYMHLEVIGAR